MTLQIGKQEIKAENLPFIAVYVSSPMNYFNRNKLLPNLTDLQICLSQTIKRNDKTISHVGLVTELTIK